MSKHRLLVSTLITAALATSLGWKLVDTLRPGIAMTQAADAFIATLSEDQKKTVVLPFETPQRVGWHFIPKAERKGLQIKEMSPEQRRAALALLRAALSDVGYDKATKIMALEHILHELQKKRGSGPIRDPERYYFTAFGEPAETGRWGLSVEGHHLSLNFVVDQGKVISTTPAFFGANPGIVKSEVSGGLPVGTRVLADEERLAFELLGALSAEQRGKAVLSDKAPREIRAAGEAQPPQEAAAGLCVTDMDNGQRDLLRRLVLTYLNNMPEEVRDRAVDQIRGAGVENVYFAWAGADRPGVGHYYRIQGPTFLIELVNTQPDGDGNPANHIHCVWRDMRGDFALPVN